MPYWTFPSNTLLYQNNFMSEHRYRLLPTLFEEFATNKDDALAFVLKAHLFTEHLMDELLKIEFGEKYHAIEDLGLAYSKKVRFISKLGLATDEVIGSLTKLNKLRNNYAHEFKYSASISDIEQLFNGIDEIGLNMVHEQPMERRLKQYMASIFGNMFPR